jgi:predicted negative regulator of RcsB-dependent stress response
MEKEANSGGDIYALVAWADAHRKQLIWGAVVVLAVVAVVGGYFMHKNGREDAANDALFALQLPVQGRPEIQAAAVASFVQVADEYPDTSAGTRAMLVAGGMYFEGNDFEKSRGMFQRLLAGRPDYPLANLAALGVAVNLEAEGKLPEAAARYEEIVHRVPQDSTWPQAQSALGRIYTEQNHPERAFDVYKQMLEERNGDSWTMEAQPQIRELLDKYPALRQQLAPPPSAPAATPAPSPIPSPAPTLDLVKPTSPQ